MRYQKFVPAPHLAPFVECYYVWESQQVISPASPVCIESPPSGYGSLVCNTGAVYSVETHSGLLCLAPAAFITGQSTQQYRLWLTGPVRAVGVVFRPAGLSALLGLNMIDLADKRIDLAAVLGPQAGEVMEKVANAPTPAAKVAILEQLLLGQLNRRNVLPDRIDYTANRIVAQRGIVRLDELIDDAFLCRRQFERKFMHRVGVSPKFYARIRRVGYLCSVMAAQRWQVSDWQELVVQAGYYDQAHFIRDFTAFMGQRPTLYVHQNQELSRFINR